VYCALGTNCDHMFHETGSQAANFQGSASFTWLVQQGIVSWGPKRNLDGQAPENRKQHSIISTKSRKSFLYSVTELRRKMSGTVLYDIGNGEVQISILMTSLMAAVGRAL